MLKSISIKSTFSKQSLKSIFSLALLLSFSPWITAQDIPTDLTVRTTDEYKDKLKDEEIRAIYTTRDDLTVVARTGKKDFIIDIFDKSLHKIFTKELDPHKREVYAGDLFHEGDFKFFTYSFEERRMRTLNCYSLDVHTKKFTKKSLFSSPVKWYQTAMFGGGYETNSFAMSPNGAYFCVALTVLNKEENYNTVRVYSSEDESLIFEKKFQNKDKVYYIHDDLFISDDGIAYSLGKNYFKKQSIEDQANYHFLLNKISKNETTHLKIDLGTKHFINTLQIKEYNGKLNLLGFYSNIQDIAPTSRVQKGYGSIGNNFIKGGCSFVINADNLEVISENNSPFPSKVYNDLYGQSKAKKGALKNKEIRNFYVDYVISDGKGGTYITAEQFYIQIVYSTDGNGNTTTRKVPHYDDIIILKYDKDGELLWGRSIYKRALHPSYNAFYKNDALHVILNTGKNLNEKSNGRTMAAQSLLESSALYDFVYSDNGTVSHQKIQNNNKGNNYFLPQHGTFTNGRFIMMSDGRKIKNFMTLE